jgi:hypothetical protein
VRLRTVSPVYSEYPYKGTEADIERLREKFHDKITAVLASVNRENAASGTLTLGEFIEHVYFPRLDWRLSIPAGNELHIEPSTVKSYKDIWKVHVKNKPIAKTRLRDFTSRNAQRFLESLRNISRTKLIFESRISFEACSLGLSRTAHLSGLTRWKRPKREAEPRKTQ